MYLDPPKNFLGGSESDLIADNLFLPRLISCPFYNGLKLLTELSAMYFKMF